MKLLHLGSAIIKDNNLLQPVAISRSVDNMKFKKMKFHITNYPSILGHWQDYSYISHKKVSPVRSWRSYDPGPRYFIGYITEQEYDKLKDHFLDCCEFTGPFEIPYLGKEAKQFVFDYSDVAASTPLFWRLDANQPLHFLYYLTEQQADYLKDLDIYGVNLRDQPQFGPNNIRVYASGYIPLNPIYPTASNYLSSAYQVTNTSGPGPEYTNSYMGYVPYAGLQYRNAFSLDSAISLPSTAVETSNTEYTTVESGVYFGSLSSQGNLVAMQLTPTLPLEAAGSTETEPKYNPWLWGYFRLYWDDPRATTFGANSAIPALTGVVPEKYNDQIPGNFVYWVDLAICRLTGINPSSPASFNTNYFINMFNQALGYAFTSNEYINSTNQAQNTNLPYYGSNNYADYVTNGFEIFNQGRALKKSFKNLGQIIQTVSSGSFGTSNAIAAIMINKGLGFINDLSDKLIAAGINLDDLYNTSYTNQISAILSTITKASDLIIIQGVLETSVISITSPLDYISIEKTSAQSNDSAFATMADVGRKLYSLAPNLDFPNGAALSTLLDSLVTEGSKNLDISNQNSTLKPEIIDCMRYFLPQNADNQTISILNVIGTAAGYYTAELKKVNDAIAALYATSYGPQIRSALENISKIASRSVLPADLNIQPIWDYSGSGEYGYPSVTENQWVELENKYKKQYLDLLNTIKADPAKDIQFLVETINSNYDYICQQLYFEIANYNKANFATSDFGDTNTLWSFISSLPFYAADTNNLGTDALLYGCAAPNSTGEIVKSILAQAKNNQLIGQSGVGIKNPF